MKRSRYKPKPFRSPYLCELCIPLNWAQIPSQNMRCGGCRNYFCATHLPSHTLSKAFKSDRPNEQPHRCAGRLT